MSRLQFLGLLLLAAVPCAAASVDPCAATSAEPDVTLTIAIDNGRTSFQQGEIIPLHLSFTSTAKNRYSADVWRYDRSGRLHSEIYCLDPQAPDPLEGYFRSGSFGGGMTVWQQLSETPFLADADLNEWRSPAPGHYRLYAVSYRVWRPPDPKEKTRWGRIGVVVRSNVVEFDVVPASPAWQSDQLQTALKSLASPSSEDARHGARILRFLNTEDSTRALARQFWGANEQAPIGWDLMFGLYGSPYPHLAIDTLQQEIGEPDRAVTEAFIRTLVQLEITSDPAWNPPALDPADSKQRQAFWKAYQAHLEQLSGAVISLAVAALPAKTPKARALTVNGLIESRMDDAPLGHQLQYALIAAWNDLPVSTRDTLIQYRWNLIGGPAMLPILRQTVDESPPEAHTMSAMTRDAALKRIYELDPELGSSLIVREVMERGSQVSMQLIRLLSPQQIAQITSPAVERVAHGSARDLDFALLDEYGSAAAFDSIKPVFESQLGGAACDPQTHLLRYFLRVAPAYGVKQVEASMQARQSPGCYTFQLQGLADALPIAQSVAIKTLNDPDTEVAEDAALALGHWGTSEAMPALWARMEQFHTTWASREDELRSVPDFSDPASRALALQQNLVYAICSATNWICTSEQLARLKSLTLTEQRREEIEDWIKLQTHEPFQIQGSWFPEDAPTFSVLQYQALTEQNLPDKLAQFPRGSRFTYTLSAPTNLAGRENALIEGMKSVAHQRGLQVDVQKNAIQ